MSTTTSLRDVAVQFGFRHGMPPPAAKTVVEMKICEACSRTFFRHFVTVFDETENRPRRVGAVECPRCVSSSVDQQIVSTRDAEATREIMSSAREDVTRYRRAGAPPTFIGNEPKHKPRRPWAAWREPLTQALERRPLGMTRVEIGKIYGSTYPGIIQEIRHAGVKLVRVGWTNEHIGGRRHGYALYQIEVSAL